jgi:3-phenylpropionate/trans-cinnamate dioxygenase ferredoxin reductase subunit
VEADEERGWLQHGKVAAVMNATIWDQGEVIEALIRAGRTLDPDRLAEPATDLVALVSPPD